MARFNRARVIATAHKHLGKGNLKKAIREYEKILKEDPSDIRTKLKVADLYYRLGEKDRALDAFEQVAEFYASQGFYLKAVAVYKQIQRLKPNDIGVHLALGEMYQKIGLTGDAIAQYKAAIALQEKAGLQTDKLHTIERLLELDPENVRLRVSLAEAFSGQEMCLEAARHLRIAAAVLKKMDNRALYVAVCERLLYHQPDDFDINMELATHYLEEGDILKALARLQVCFKDRPEDPEVLSLVARAFEMTGQPQKATAVLKVLADVYDRTGLINERDDVLRQILELSPGDPTAKRRLQPAEQAHEEAGRELEFESAPSFPVAVGEGGAVFQEEDVEVLEVGEEEDTNPEIVLPPEVREAAQGQAEDGSLFSPMAEGDKSPLVGLEDQFEPTPVDAIKPWTEETQKAEDLEATSGIPEEFKPDIESLDFLIEVGMLDDARELVKDIRSRGGDFPALQDYERRLSEKQ